MTIEVAMEVEESLREEEEIIHGEKRERSDEDHQGEAQQKMVMFEPVVEGEVANTSSWDNIIRPMERCDPLEILWEENGRREENK